ncbi:MAG: CPBP family intramembrane metalloprotease [Oscillospiraceae bacterium]|nr:CPBP family intramembrane metalloprotease [Oscillospiraceae bacterium]
MSREEKRRLRHTYNVIGLTLLILYISILIAVVIGYAVYYSNPANQIVYGENDIPIYPFGHVAIGLCVPALAAMAVFAGYCLLAHYDPSELFRTENIRPGEIFRFSMIILFFRQVCIFADPIIDSVLDRFGLEVTGFDYDIEHSLPTYLIEIFATVVLAPIGEELVFRGVVLRCSSKISQRFGIFFSAFIFGMMHGNPYQFLLGFINGIFLALIAIRTGSLIPAMICHAVNNASGAVPLIILYFNEDMAHLVDLLMMIVFFTAGLIVTVRTFTSGDLKLPEYTMWHKARTLPILVTSWSTITVMVFYIIDFIGSIDRLEIPEQILTEVIRTVFK